jgi:hypothetical protein
MNDLLLYLYGIITGLAIAASIMYVGNLIEKAFKAGFAGSAPSTKQAVKANFDKTERPY